MRELLGRSVWERGGLQRLTKKSLPQPGLQAGIELEGMLFD